MTQLKTIFDLPRHDGDTDEALIPIWIDGETKSVRFSGSSISVVGLVANDPAAAAANVALINAAIAKANAAWVALTGAVEVLLPAGKFWIAGTLAMLSGVELWGAGISRTVLYMSAANYPNTTWSARNSTSLAIEASGMFTAPYTRARNMKLCNFTLQSEVSDGRVLYGIRASNVDTIEICNVEIFGFPVGNLLEMNSILGSSSVHHCAFRDSGTAVTTYGLQPQTTAIEVDNNKINGDQSRGLDIHDNTMIDIMFSGAALGSYGAQTDAVNAADGIGLRIHDNYARNVGEGIDVFAFDCDISGNVLVDCYHVGLKLIHGASRNNLHGNHILRPGRAGVALSGGSAETKDNYIHGNSIHDVNISGVWNALTNAALLVVSGGGIEANNNTCRDNKVTGGANMDYAVLNEAGTGNRFYDTEAESWLILYSAVTGGAASITNAKKTLVRVGLNATEATASGVEKIVQFETEEVDTQGEFDTTTFTFTSKSHRYLSVRAAVRCSPAASGESWTLRIKKNGSTRAEAVTVSAGTPEQYSVSDAFAVVPGDTVAVFVLQSSGARNIGCSSTAAYLTIEEVSS